MTVRACWTTVAVLVALLFVEATWGVFSSATDNGSNVLEAAASFCEAPGPQTVTADADTYVDERQPADNFGTDTTLELRSWQSGSNQRNRRVLVRFSLPATPDRCAMASSTLRLNASSATSGRTLQAYRISASWTEGGATWNNQPATTGSASTTSSATGWVEFDVTQQTVDMYAGWNHGLLVRDANENVTPHASQTYSSREGSNPPELVVVFE